MTENEALKLGKLLYENITSNANNIILTDKYIEFVRIANEALEEIQEFRKQGITIEKALDTMCDLAGVESVIDEYRAIGTVEELQALKEKSEPKKLKHDVCPNCSTNNDMIIKHLGNPQAHKVVFCWNCGQALDWEN